MYYFYTLRSLVDDKLYKGSTQDVSERLKQHNSGKVSATISRKPFRVIYQEVFYTREEALQKEKYYKSFKGGKELAKIVKDL